MGMKFTYNSSSIKTRRREFRGSMTKEEIILWRCLKISRLGVKFRRQVSIEHYIVDFYCPKYHYVVELDGSQHADNIDYDARRDDFLKSKGCTVRRFENSQIHTELPAVLDTIWSDLELICNRTTPPFDSSGHPS